MLKTIFFALLLGLTSWFSSCQDTKELEETNIQTPLDNKLVSAQKLATIKAIGLKEIALANEQAALAALVTYDVDVYRLLYHTTYNGKQIRASGLMVVPLNLATPAPILSAHHGTTFDQKYAPSNFQPDSFTGFEAFGAAGYLTLVPDFIGYGESKQILHPYYDVAHSGRAVVDMIKAGKEFFLKNKINVSDQLFLAGYSEGGYVTLATQKEIETNPDHGLKVTAAAAGAGGYDLEGMLARVVSGQAYDYPANLAFLLQAYNKTYGWNRPLTDFFQEPYATRIQELIDGTRTSASINSALAKDPALLFNPAFLTALRGNGEQALKQALAQNSLKHWVPKSPTRLYHGTADDMVPFENSLSTYNAMKTAGATQVTLVPIQGGTHFSSLEPMIKDLIPWVESLKK